MPEINDLRDKIDEITLEMIRLLKKRQKISKEIGQIKKNLGKGVTDESRESFLRKKILKLCEEIELDEKTGSKLLNFLLNESIIEQSKSKQTHLSIFLKAKKLESEGKKMIHMEVGEPDFSPPAKVENALSEACQKGFRKYSHSKGMTEFRNKIAEKIQNDFGIKTSFENILISPGARFSVYSAVTTLLKPGDEMIVIEPAWPAYIGCALTAGVKVRTIHTTLEEDWNPSLETIENTVNSNTKMIVLNYPNNPTGKILPKKIFDGIMDIAAKNNLYVLSDEIYSNYAYVDWRSALAYEYENTIITQSFSKSHAMTGFRIGYAVAAKQILDKMTKLSALCLTSVAEPIQYVAMHTIESDISNNSQIMKQRLDLLSKRGNDMGLKFMNPNGAMYLFATVDQDDFDGTKFANTCLESGLAVAPGEGFGSYNEFFRLSACQDEKTLIEGMSKLDHILRENNG